MNIGKVELKGNLFLAPLAGVSDLAFRLLAKKNGADLTCTEMVSAKAITYKNKNTFDLLTTVEEEGITALQLFGSEPKVMAEAIKIIEEYPFEIIDINMGCPVPKVVNNGDGSALLKNPKLVYDLVSSAVKATDKPITVKIRKGFDTINAVEIAKVIEEAGAKAVALHGRTREEYYTGLADWDIISKVKEAINIPLIGNGDVDTPQKAIDMFEKTKCDAILIGRGARGNPFIFNQIKNYCKTGIIEEVDTKVKIDTILEHTKLLVKFKGENVGIREMRKNLAWYTKGMRYSAKLRAKCNYVSTFEDVKELVKEFYET